MEPKGVVTVIIITFIVNGISTLDDTDYIQEYYSLPIQIPTEISTGVSLMLFPLMGWIADVILTRYKALKLATVFMLVIMYAVAINHGVKLCLELLMYDSPKWLHKIERCAMIPLITLLAVLCVGLFKANAIQFGTDQLLEASSSQLSAFIHWYFWSMHIGPLLSFYVESSTKLLFHHNDLYAQVFKIFMSITSTFLYALSLLLLIHCKKNMYIEKAGENPFRKVCKVLKFAWKHKYPVNRSAFTYCEENTPSRMDLGKKQYGGPFSTEEVEDVKSFLRLLLLLVSLFGYHVAGDGFAIAQHMEHYSCPSLTVWFTLVYNPLHISLLIIALTIPLVHCMPNLHRSTPNMLKRMGIGLVLLLLQELAYTALLATYMYPGLHHSNKTIAPGDGTKHTETKICYDLLSNETATISTDSTFLWLIGPQILHGLAQLLVNLTALEFICAQAPRTMQGLLIGLWYATFSIHYLLMCPLDSFLHSSTISMLIYQAVRSGLVLVSVVMYLCVSRAYQYRVRDWVVNVQWMIEDIIGRRIDQRERYESEQQALLESLYQQSAEINIREE